MSWRKTAGRQKCNKVIHTIVSSIQIAFFAYLAPVYRYIFKYLLEPIGNLCKLAAICCESMQIFRTWVSLPVTFKVKGFAHSPLGCSWIYCMPKNLGQFQGAMQERKKTQGLWLYLSYNLQAWYHFEYCINIRTFEHIFWSTCCPNMVTLNLDRARERDRQIKAAHSIANIQKVPKSNRKYSNVTNEEQQ